MDYKRNRAALAAIGLCLALPATASEWSYEGMTGPAEWGAMSPDNAACLGQQQSPIDLTTTNTAGVDTVETDWKPMALDVVDNGHTIQANAAPGNSTRFGNRHFDLLQVHFHAASEHTVFGRHLPVEAHFVHKSPEGDLLVLGVMIEPGEPNDALEAIWRGAPGSQYPVAPAILAPVSPDNGDGTDHTTTHAIGTVPGMEPVPAMVDFAAILPENQGRFQYAGSLTTPPCSEIVNWVVFSTPVTASAEQIALFTNHYNNNYRPVQPRNRRFILYGN